jgi:hypothetical protein
MLLVGVVLAFPLAIGICTALGLVLVIVERWATPCPKCAARKLRNINGIRETYPTGKGTGTFYVCDDCQHRVFWSNDDRGWQDANAQKFDHWYQPRVA